MYDDKNVTLYKSNFSIDKLPAGKYSLWNIAPIWPGRTKAKITEEKLEELIYDAYSRSTIQAHMILWIPASELHQTIFEPTRMCSDWLPRATIISGSDPIHIGYIYSKSESPIKWKSKLILDARGKRGVSSSKTIRFLIDNICKYIGTVVDPFAHKSALLPLWTRRLGHSYIGYTSSKKTYKTIANKLSQVELPYTQLNLIK